ncbi:uncharacterized protein LOC134299000 [Anolis carolinensis]|uniref:uncharacterized protein LOC134299000 n=1 Tax=Anolis carolinensis TaxID=28377 RepID=UPI002F2B6E56
MLFCTEASFGAVSSGFFSLSLSLSFGCVPANSGRPGLMYGPCRLWLFSFFSFLFFSFCCLSAYVAEFPPMHRLSLLSRLSFFTPLCEFAPKPPLGRRPLFLPVWESCRPTVAGLVFYSVGLFGGGFFCLFFGLCCLSAYVAEFPRCTASLFSRRLSFFSPLCYFAQKPPLGRCPLVFFLSLSLSQGCVPANSGRPGLMYGPCRLWLFSFFSFLFFSFCCLSAYVAEFPPMHRLSLLSRLSFFTPLCEFAPKPPLGRRPLFLPVWESCRPTVAGLVFYSVGLFGGGFFCLFFGLCCLSAYVAEFPRCTASLFSRRLSFFSPLCYFAQKPPLGRCPLVFFLSLSLSQGCVPANSGRPGLMYGPCRLWLFSFFSFLFFSFCCLSAYVVGFPTMHRLSLLSPAVFL